MVVVVVLVLHLFLLVLMAGRAGGTIDTGRHIKYENGTPMTNLFLTMLDNVGVQPERIGDSTGKIEHLTEL